jgi:hypothetical protein
MAELECSGTLDEGALPVVTPRERTHAIIADAKAQRPNA